MQSPQHHHKNADKTNIFVVLNKKITIQNYKIFSMTIKNSKKLNKNPTKQLKSKINKLFIANNAELNSTTPLKIIGD